MQTTFFERRELARLNQFAERQLGKNDCGLTVIKTALNLCGHDIARHQIRDAIALDEEGSSFDAIKNYLTSEKVTCSYKVIELAEIGSAKLDAILPCIAMVSRGKYNHYIVIYAIHGRKVTIMDPENGRFEIKDVQYLNDNLLRISTHANAELSYAFMESYIARKCAEFGVADQAPMERSLIVSRYNKIRYMEWLSTQVQFAGPEQSRTFLEELFACDDDSVIPSRFKTFRLDAEQLNVKSPVVLSFKLERTVAAVAGEMRDPIARLLREMISQPALRKSLVQLIGVGVFVSIISFLVVYANQIMVDEIIPTRELATLYAFIGVLFFFRLFELVQNVIKSLIEIRLTQMLDNWLCSSYNEAVVYSSGEALATYSRGELTQRINDILRIKGVVTSYVNDYIFSLITVAFCLLMTTYISLPVAGVILAVSLAYGLILRKAVDIVKALESRRFTQKGILVNSLINLIEGHAVIAKTGCEPVFVEDQQRKLGSFLQVQQKSMIASHMLAYLPRFIAVIGSLSVILITAKLHIVNGTISLGQIFTLMALSEMAFQGLRTVLRTQLNLQEQAVVIDRFFEIRQLEQRVIAEPCDSRVSQLALHDVVYHYPGRQFGIDIPALTFNAGDRVLLQGPNGSGKSTLLKVLAGMTRKGLEGSIVFYAGEHTPLSRDAGFAKVSLIRAEDKIFSDTIQFNVTFSNARGGKNIYKYAKLVHADDFISPITHPIDSLIHDQGANLSTGQKRKLLILRALVSSADIIIFDEIFRGIDADSKAVIVQTLNAMSKEKIVIYTTHEAIDELHITRVLDIDNGKVSEVALAPTELAA
jgi:subfamily B ATP-binding cassette protein HlyB/CyaB